ncbi:hypothetical protein CORT_0A04330 [Candida orthopsilosis Co 90-125]|uniref:YCII-related domain-containing protein n=1 Tax=Candida orthopsilosis (strain 90-125) TaxID=1136231 RepID=H8WWJ7_CANO9|nr:hypothetical protein CORT_0A04330 [Candida orthopsilosis Co 90-125]CCG20821.1 hypothetical protein CORT_0A04330 [Candida orthopsilosis Co 90-125]
MYYQSSLCNVCYKNALTLTKVCPLHTYTIQMIRLLSPIRRFSSSLRTMSSEYLVTVYDFPNADRSKVRPQHVAAIPANVPNPVRAAGAIYTDESKTKFAGSTFHLASNSRDEIIEFLKRDIYYKEGIWNLDSVQIYPLGIAVRLPKKLDGVDESNYKI